MVVTAAVMCKSINQGAETEMLPQDISTALYELRDADGDILWWWHSHVNMGVGFSGTDVNTIKQIGEQGCCVGTVFNKKGAMNSAMFIKTDPMYPNIYVDTGLETQIDSGFDDSFYAKVMEEYTAKFVPMEVKKASPLDDYGYGGLLRGKYLTEQKPTLTAKKTTSASATDTSSFKGLPEGYVHKAYVVIEANGGEYGGWYVDIDLMAKVEADEWKKLYMETHGRGLIHDYDLQCFVEDTLYALGSYDA